MKIYDCFLPFLFSFHLLLDEKYREYFGSNYLQRTAQWSLNIEIISINCEDDYDRWTSRRGASNSEEFVLRNRKFHFSTRSNVANCSTFLNRRELWENYFPTIILQVWPIARDPKNKRDSTIDEKVLYLNDLLSLESLLSSYYRTKPNEENSCQKDRAISWEKHRSNKDSSLSTSNNHRSNLANVNPTDHSNRFRNISKWNDNEGHEDEMDKFDYAKLNSPRKWIAFKFNWNWNFRLSLFFSPRKKHVRAVVFVHFDVHHWSLKQCRSTKVSEITSEFGFDMFPTENKMIEDEFFSWENVDFVEWIESKIKKKDVGRVFL